MPRDLKAACTAATVSPPAGADPIANAMDRWSGTDSPRPYRRSSSHIASETSPERSGKGLDLADPEDLLEVLVEAEGFPAFADDVALGLLLLEEPLIQHESASRGDPGLVGAFQAALPQLGG